MKVRVNKLCFVGGARRKPGDVIEYTGKLSDWMEPVDEVEPRKVRKARALDAIQPAIEAEGTDDI